MIQLPNPNQTKTQAKTNFLAFTKDVKSIAGVFRYSNNDDNNRTLTSKTYHILIGIKKTNPEWWQLKLLSKPRPLKVGISYFVEVWYIAVSIDCRFLSR